jgi:sugar lactone lactonase YvrE
MSLLRLPAALLFLGGAAILSAVSERSTLPPAGSFAFTLKRPATASAGVFDAQGRLVRVLWTMKSLPAGKRTGRWDGEDDFGKKAPPGEYRFRVIVNPTAYRNVGAIGNDGQPPDASGHTPTNMESVAADADGAVYVANGWDEAGADFKKWDASGKSAYDADYQIRNGDPNGAPYSIAVDDQFLYCGVGGWASAPWNERQQVQRFRRSDDKQVPFTHTGRADGHVNLYEWPSKLIPKGTPDADADLMKAPIRALAIQGDTLLTADALGGRIVRFQKDSGRPEGEFPVKLPQALAVAPNGEVWVGHAHHLVSRYSAGGEFLGDALTDVGEVESLAFGPDGTLCVADGGAGQVKFYRLREGQARLVRTLGRKARPGDRDPALFYRLRGAAVDPHGNLFAIQTEPMGGARLAKWSPDGKLLWERFGNEFVSLGNYGGSRPDLFRSMSFHLYRLKDRNAGTWERLGNEFPGGPKRTSDVHGVPRVLRLGKNDFYFYPSGDGVQIFRIEGKVLRLAALVGGRDPGPEGAKSDRQGEWSWHDASGSGIPKPDEIRWFKKPGEANYAVFGMDSDDDGDLWFANLSTRGVWELPLGPLDAKGNPTYDWARAREAIPADESALKFQPSMAQRGEDGSVYAFGWSERWPSPKDNPFWMGGSTLARFDKSGKRLWAVPLPETCVGLDWVPGGGCMAGGGKSAKIYHYSVEGLLIGVMAPGKAMGGVSGWMDNHASVAVNRDPKDGVLDVFAEDDYAQRIGWYRADDRKIERIAGRVRRP